MGINTRTDLINAIEGAIAKKTSIQITYNGGSHPGTSREILPTRFSKNNVYARCRATDEFKMFNLDKMELINSHDSQKKWVDIEIELKKNTTFHSIQDLLDQKQTEFESMGYIVISNGENIKLHRIEKGKISKSFYTSIEQFEEEGDFVISLQVADLTKPLVSSKKESNLTKWRVCCILKSMQSYKDFEKAAKAFYQRSIAVADIIRQEAGL